MRASEIALVSQVKREREKSNKILEEAETAVHSSFSTLSPTDEPNRSLACPNISHSFATPSTCAHPAHNPLPLPHQEPLVGHRRPKVNSNPPIPPLWHVCPDHQTFRVFMRTTSPFIPPQTSAHQVHRVHDARQKQKVICPHRSSLFPHAPHHHRLCLALISLSQSPLLAGSLAGGRVGSLSTR